MGCWRGFLGLKEEVLLAHEVNCLSNKRTPNATKFDRQVTRIKTTSHDKSHAKPETLHGQTQKKDSGKPRARGRASELETDNGKNEWDRMQTTTQKQCK